MDFGTLLGDFLALVCDPLFEVLLLFLEGLLGNLIIFKLLFELFPLIFTLFCDSSLDLIKKDIHLRAIIEEEILELVRGVVLEAIVIEDRPYLLRFVVDHSLGLLLDCLLAAEVPSCSRELLGL